MRSSGTRRRRRKSKVRRRQRRRPFEARRLEREEERPQVRAALVRIRELLAGRRRSSGLRRTMLHAGNLVYAHVGRKLDVVSEPIGREQAMRLEVHFVGAVHVHHVRAGAGLVEHVVAHGHGVGRAVRQIASSPFIGDVWWSGDGQRVYAIGGGDDSVGGVSDLLSGKAVTTFCRRGDIAAQVCV